MSTKEQNQSDVTDLSSGNQTERAKRNNVKLLIYVIVISHKGELDRRQEKKDRLIEKNQLCKAVVSMKMN